LTRTVAVMIGRSPEKRYSVHRGYVDALVAVGALPLMLAVGPGIDTEPVLDAMARCVGLMLTGGNDVDPQVYGLQPGRGEKDTDPDRDAIEIMAVHAAMSAGQPVLGICRGIQLLAAALGGALIGDLPAAGYTGHEEEAHEGEPVHAVTADAGSLAALVLAGATEVNSIHHQAVATTGPVLTATAWSPDGVIEAVEAPGVIGVQWHPERMIGTDPRHLAPFRWVMGA
jgi:putative glutamine amidotransferase